jgi:signal transduction histidine kinase/ligand-binding sensor domain-containing protein/DNA-binding response OmpR family regulator
MKIFVALLLSTLFCIPSICVGQTNMIVEHYAAEQGLPNNIVDYSLKDRDGLLWFGTWYGLCSFDGIKFTSYIMRVNNQSDVPPRKVQSIVEDGNGFLWICTIDRKLYVFDKHKEAFYEVYDEIKKYTRNVQIIKIQSTSDHNVLLLTKDKNLFLAGTTPDGHIHIRLLYDACNDINPYDMKLKHNVLGETKEYILWIGKDYKIFAIRKGRSLYSQCNNFISKQFSSSLARLTSIYYDGHFIWAGSDKGHVYCITPYSGKVRTYSFTQIQTPVTNIMQTGGSLYLSSLSGIYACSLSEKLHLLPVNCRNVQDSYTDVYHKMWFLDNGEALVYYDPVNQFIRCFPFYKKKSIVSLSIQDAGENGLFILTPGGNVWMFDRENISMTDISKLKPFSEETLGQLFFHIFLDHDGVLWLASTVNGVYRVNFPRKQFKFICPSLFSNKMGDQKLGIRSLFQAHNGDIWVGTRWGDVYCIDTDCNVKRYFKGTIGNVYHIMEDRQGRLWFSTKGDGLLKVEPDNLAPQGYRFTRYKYNPNQISSISSNNVYSTFQDKYGHIWVGTFGGGLDLIEEQGSNVIFHHKYNGFKKYPQYGLYMDVRAMVEDNSGRIWVGTVDGLLSFNSDFTRLEDICFETYRNDVDAGISDKDIYALYKDAKGYIWLGIFGGGLNKIIHYDAKGHCPIFKSYSIREGLNCDVVSSIIEDSHGVIWLGTESGLSSLDRHTGIIRNYDRYDGFPNVDIEDNTMLYTLNGEIWMGCKQGLLSFFPEKITKQQNISYKTFIIDFKVLNRDLHSFNPPIYEGSVRYADEIKLKHDQSMFTIEFASLNYTNQNRISYKYILEGYEKDWHFSGHNRVASYANVPPGHYVFCVQTQDEANLGISSKCSMKITVLSPWWATWWAYSIYSILGIALLIAAIRLAYLMMKMKNEVYIGQRLAELKIRFFTNISHELRTPLTLIQGPIQELKEKENLSEKGKQYVALMEKNSGQMLQLINQILDFRKVQSGKMRLHVSLVDINEILNTFHHEFQMLADEKEVAFVFQLPQEHVAVWGDKEKLDIVIRNLLSNAFKFTPANGTVGVILELLDEENRCRIRVEDNGASIPEGQLTEIFERFAQAENANEESSYTGTGIGLALSKELVNLHHGKIWAENNSDQMGVAFIVDLQTGKEHFDSNKVDFYVDDATASLDEDIQQKDVMPGTADADSSLPVLLLVEDNKDLCQMLKMQMESQFNVYTANDGLDGMKKVYLYHPDIVVTDQMMPGIDGIELLTRIRKDFQISHIPVIILTAKNGEEDKMRAIQIGANAYITKPFSRNYLEACINQLLNERRLFHEKMWAYELGDGEDINDEKGNYEQHLVKKDVQFIKQIHEVIEENLNESDFNIDTIANTIGLSRSAFFKKLKSLTGFAPVDLVKEIRLNRAVELIKNTDMNISEIAFDVGFKDSGYFSKCFRKKYNQTPKDYQNEWRLLH